ncbi:DMT family transporter [Dethiothermospora halolimnae]|uniref:DMT family transporter n=1 Tax=Dethiothermospora halolimnae TaxID=3114390 RepID=UPI003CCBCC7F
MKRDHKSLYADLSLLLVAIIWGSGFVATKIASNSITALYMNAFRFSIASILMVIVFFKRLKKANKNDVVAGAIIGFFLFSAFAAQTMGIYYTTPSKQAFLTGTNVVMVPFLYWIVEGEKPDRYNFIAAFLAVIGIGLLTLNKGIDINKGDSLTLLCALLFACHIVSIGLFAKKHDPVILTVIQFITAAVLSIVLSFIFEPIPNSVTTKGIMAILYLGVFSTLVAFLIQTVAQKYTTSTHTAIILCLEAVFGSLLSVIILGDPFTVQMIIGSVVVFISIITAETKWKFIRGNRKGEINNS